MGIGRLGFWETSFGWNRLGEPATLAALEELGISTLWLGGSPNGDLRSTEELLAASTTLTVATGIVNVWEAAPAVTAESFHRVVAQHPGRLMLGIGAGHRAIIGDRYEKPYDKLVSYLDGLDAGGVPVENRMLAALGPKVLQLARDRTAGAHPYLTTPAHTERAREILGAGKLLVPEQKVVLETDPARARTIARDKLAMYLALSNYTNNWLRLGYTEDDLADGGSDRLVDGLVAWGDEDAIRTRVHEHLDAGADQVALQVLGDDKLSVLRTLTPALV